MADTVLILSELREVREELKRLAQPVPDPSPEDLRETVLDQLDQLTQLFSKQCQTHGLDPLLEAISRIIAEAQVSIARLRRQPVL